MGSEFRIVAWSESSTAAAEGARAAFARIKALDDALSDWQPDSELSRLSRSAPGVPVPVGADLFEVLALAREASLASDGAFDVTVGPCVVLWRRACRQLELPTAARLEAARAAVGFRLVELDVDRRTVTLGAASMRLDLGGIAKGYAGDAALAALAASGITRALVDGGGDLAVGEPPPGETGWLVAIQPLEDAAAPREAVRVARCGIASSGDLFRYVEIDGVRKAHKVDTRTRLGVQERGSPPVIAPPGAMAHARASAACVLEPEAALAAVARVDGATALVRRAADGRTVTRSSAGFPARLAHTAR